MNVRNFVVGCLITSLMLAALSHDVLAVEGTGGMQILRDGNAGGTHGGGSGILPTGGYRYADTIHFYLRWQSTINPAQFHNTHGVRVHYYNANGQYVTSRDFGKCDAFSTAGWKMIDYRVITGGRHRW